MNYRLEHGLRSKYKKSKIWTYWSTPSKMPSPSTWSSTISLSGQYFTVSILTSDTRIGDGGNRKRWHIYLLPGESILHRPDPKLGSRQTEVSRTVEGLNPKVPTNMRTWSLYIWIRTVLFFIATTLFNLWGHLVSQPSGSNTRSKRWPSATLEFV